MALVSRWLVLLWAASVFGAGGLATPAVLLVAVAGCRAGRRLLALAQHLGGDTLQQGIPIASPNLQHQTGQVGDVLG